jgi:hypothetical protein
VEVQSLLYTALDIGYLTEDRFKSISAQIEKTKALTGGLKNSLKPRK